MEVISRKYRLDSFGKVGGACAQRVISEAHVPGNDKFQMISSYGEML